MSAPSPTSILIMETAMRADGVPSNRIAQSIAAAHGEVAVVAPPPPRMTTIPQAAVIMQCTPRTIQRWISDGRVEVVRKGRLVRIVESSLYDSK
jgi:excisionase family DNA binding protein